jgi:hypothetical protein
MAAVVAPATGAPCTNQVINVSAGTTLTYVSNSTTAATAYDVTSTNSGGSGKFYCYSSAAGGSISNVSAVITTYRAAC